MARLLLLLIIVVPAIEISLFIIAGKTFGFLPTLLFILVTGVFGAWFAKREGLQVLKLAQIQSQRGEVPSEAILDGICILIGGIFLISPGFITDIIGLLLVIPYTRTLFKIVLKKMFKYYIAGGNSY